MLYTNTARPAVGHILIEGPYPLRVSLNTIKTIIASGEENKTGTLEADFPDFSDTTACMTLENCCCSLYQPAPLWLVEKKLRNIRILKEGIFSSSSDGAAFKKTSIFKTWFSLRMTRWMINNFVDTFAVYSAVAFPLEKQWYN